MARDYEDCAARVSPRFPRPGLVWIKMLSARPRGMVRLTHTTVFVVWIAKTARESDALSRAALNPFWIGLPGIAGDHLDGGVMTRRTGG